MVAHASRSGRSVSAASPAILRRMSRITRPSRVRRNLSWRRARSPTLMTRHRIAQIGENRNPKSPEDRRQPAAAGKSDYFRRAARPSCSTTWRFFTGDNQRLLRSFLAPGFPAGVSRDAARALEAMVMNVLDQAASQTSTNFSSRSAHYGLTHS